jgi:hypothetical protein
MPEPQVIVKTEYQKQMVPSAWVVDCLAPPQPREDAKNNELVEYMVSMELALKDCNTDKRAIRQWQSKELVTQ